MIQHNTGLDCDGACLFIKVYDMTKPSTIVDDQRLSHGLTALACPRASRQYRDFLISRDIEYTQDIRLIPRHHHTNRSDLIDRGVG